MKTADYAIIAGAALAVGVLWKVTRQQIKAPSTVAPATAPTVPTMSAFDMVNLWNLSTGGILPIYAGVSASAPYGNESGNWSYE